MLLKSIFGFFFSVICSLFNFVVGVVHVVLGGAAAAISFCVVKILMEKVLDRLVVQDIAAVKKISEEILKFQRFLETSPGWYTREIRDYLDRFQLLKKDLMFSYFLLDDCCVKLNAFLDKINDSFRVEGPIYISREDLDFWNLLELLGFDGKKEKIFTFDVMLSYFDKSFPFRCILYTRYRISKLCGKFLKYFRYSTYLKRSRKCKPRKASEEAVKPNSENILANKDSNSSSTDNILVRDIPSFDKELCVENCSSDCTADRIVT